MRIYIFIAEFYQVGSGRMKTTTFAVCVCVFIAMRQKSTYIFTE